MEQALNSTVPDPLVVPALAGKTGDLSKTGQAQFPPKGGTTNKVGQSNYKYILKEELKRHDIRAIQPAG